MEPSVVRARERKEVGGQADLGRQERCSTPWLTERHGFDPTCGDQRRLIDLNPLSIERLDEALVDLKQCRQVIQRIGTISGASKGKKSQWTNQNRAGINATNLLAAEVGGQAVLGRQERCSTPWLTERHGYDPTSAGEPKDWNHQWCEQGKEKSVDQPEQGGH